MKLVKTLPMMAILVFLASCGNQQVVKNTTSSTVAASSVAAVSSAAAPVYDRMKDVSYSNAVAFLQESMLKENADPAPANKLNTGKAFLLLLQVLRDRYVQFGDSGFEKIGFSTKEFDNYKNVARVKLTDVINDPKTSADDKVEAKQRSDQLEMLILK